MKRDLSRLQGSSFDVLVIGGGIYGAWTAYDAALRGLTVALVDKGDWAGGTSSASTKLIHGGLRYLEQYRFGLVRKSLGERARLLRLAPHAVKPLNFVVPAYRGDRVAPWRLRAGLFLYDALAGGGHRSRALSRRDVHQRYPFLLKDELRGGFVYTDCQMDDARLAIEIVDGASQAGAVVANYAEVSALLSDPTGRVRGAAVRDVFTGRCFEVDANVVVNAAGPWADHLGPIESGIRLVKGAHLVMPALPTPDAFLFMTRRDQRVFFLVPWYGRTLLGTTDSDYEGIPDDVDVTGADVDYLLGEARRYLGEHAWSESDVLGRFAGVRALQGDDTATASGVTREWTMVEPRDGLIVSVGGKYTSARAESGHMVNRVLRIMGRSAGGTSPTENRPFPWCPATDGEPVTLEPSVGRETAVTLASRYGRRTADIHALISGDPQLAEPIVPGLPFVAAEIEHAVTHEMAITLEDMLRRRMPVVLLTDISSEVLRAVAERMAGHLGWSPEEVSRQVDETRRRWPGATTA